jgi:hypothetical protein
VVQRDNATRTYCGAGIGVTRIRIWSRLECVKGSWPDPFKVRDKHHGLILSRVHDTYGLILSRVHDKRHGLILSRAHDERHGLPICLEPMRLLSGAQPLWVGGGRLRSRAGGGGRALECHGSIMNAMDAMNGIGSFMFEPWLNGSARGWAVGWWFPERARRGAGSGGERTSPGMGGVPSHLAQRADLAWQFQAGRRALRVRQKDGVEGRGKRPLNAPIKVRNHV